jgi:hypothetical protein
MPCDPYRALCRDRRGRLGFTRCQYLGVSFGMQTLGSLFTMELENGAANSGAVFFLAWQRSRLDFV